jgi:hypothetical protein
MDEGLTTLEMAGRDASREPDGEPYIDPKDISIFGPATLEQMFLHSLNRTNPDVARKLILVSRFSKSYEFRKLIEKLNARQQCEYLFSTKPRDNKSECWLCGFTIENFGAALEHNRKPLWIATKQVSSALNAPECEHIIPISAAVMIFGAVASAQDAKQPGAQEYYSLNYEWAHKFCNGLKSDSLFVNLRNKDGSLKVDIDINKEYITQFLNKLYHESPELQLMTQKKRDLWIAYRELTIYQRLEPLVRLINEKFKISILSAIDKVIEGIENIYTSLIKALEEDPAGKIISNQPLTNKQTLELINQQKDQLDGRALNEREKELALELLKLGKGRRKSLKSKNNGKLIPSRKGRGKKGRTSRNSKIY